MGGMGGMPGMGGGMPNMPPGMMEALMSGTLFLTFSCISPNLHPPLFFVPLAALLFRSFVV
jgi:hypothetical protein